MAIVAWLMVITGTYIIYPWYRAPAPEGADLSLYPRSFLRASETLSGLHTFGMEWKEHIAWFAPILATVVAYLVMRYGPELAKNSQLRRIAVVLQPLGMAYLGQGDLATARQYLEEAVASAESLGEPRELDRIAGAVSVVCGQQRLVSRVLRIFRNRRLRQHAAKRCREVAENLGNHKTNLPPWILSP